MKRFTLDSPEFKGLTGQGVRVAVIDSGIHYPHPHISAVARAVRITADGVDDDAADRLGHGTAVAAAILEKAPGIELVAIRVFEHTLTTSAQLLREAMAWAVADGCQLINLSLGSTNAALTLPPGARVVAAADWYPGCLPGAIAVRMDPACPRDEIWVDGVITASPYPRPIPSIPIDRNLSGISFAVANVTGFMARALERGETLPIQA